MFSNPEVLDKIDSANFEDERIEDNFVEFNLDINLLPMEEEKDPDVAAQEDDIIQLEETNEEVFKHNMTLDLVLLYFIKDINDDYYDRPEKDFIDVFQLKSRKCPKRMMRLLNCDIFPVKSFNPLINYFSELGLFKFNEDSFKKEEKAARLFGLYNHEVEEIYHPIKDFLFN